MIVQVDPSVFTSTPKTAQVNIFQELEAPQEQSGISLFYKSFTIVVNPNTVYAKPINCCFCNNDEAILSTKIEKLSITENRELKKIIEIKQPELIDISTFVPLTQDKVVSDASVKDLMALSDLDWSSRSTEPLIKKMVEYIEYFVPEELSTTMAGFLEKHDLAPGSEVAVIGDIHANRKRLHRTLFSLQELKFLDENFQCYQGKSVIFLGDYADKGEDSLGVLDLVIGLKKENPYQVHLLRGNHEDLQTSNGKLDRYALLDPKYQEFMKDEHNRKILDRFYKRLPVCLYIGEKRDSKEREYGQFCHGLFHLYTDPVSLFETSGKAMRLWVTESSGFSKRVKKLFEDTTDQGRKLRAAAEELNFLKLRMFGIRFDDIYWLDIAPMFSYDPCLGRTYVDPESTKAYLKVSSTESSKVKEVFRGHQNKIETLCDTKGKALVTTIDASAYTMQQIFMTIKLAPKVRNWQKSWVKIDL